MTKIEAVAEMMKGEKVTHRYFSSHEWMTMKGNFILFEDGVRLPSYEFWPDRIGENWEDGYSLFVD